MNESAFDLFSRAQNRPSIDHEQSTRALWTNPHIAQQMLGFHLDPTNDAASYRHEIIDHAVEWMVARFALDSRSQYLDLGCGPGQYTRRIAERGVHVTGIDFSENSIRYAQEQARIKSLDVDYRCRNYLDIDFSNQFHLVTLISCDFSALIPKERSTFLSNVRNAMTDTGRFVFDFHSRVRFGTLSEQSSWTYYDETGFYAEGPHLLLTNQFLFEPEGICCTKYTIVPIDDEARELYLWHRYYHLNDVMSILSDAGLHILEVYGRIDGEPFTGNELDITVVAGKTK